MSDNCPDCTHPKAHHTALVGCLHDGDDICDCDRSFPEAAKTAATAVVETEQALEKVERGTDPVWADHATEAIKDLARTVDPIQGCFSTDDVWKLLEERKVPPPREPRALGTIMRELKRAKVLEAHGFTASVRRHQTPVRTYSAGPAL